MSNETKKYGNYLKSQKEHLTNQVARMTALLMKKENDLLRQEQALVSGGTPGKMARHYEQMPTYIQPGNAGDINKVIWPSFFTTEVVQVNPNQQVDSGFSISKTAGFIMVNYSKVVFIEEEIATPAFIWTYLNPDDPIGTGKSPGLSFNMRNSSSTREFMDTTVPMDDIGNPRWPTYLLAPQLLRPNENMEFTFINDHPANIYRAAIVFYGVRIRIEDSYNLLSTVYADSES